MSAPVLEVEDLRVAVGDVPLVRGVSFSLGASRRLGVVGESGSGKTLTALALMGLHRPPVRVVGGRARLGEVDLLALSRRELDQVRGRRIAMIYQDPGTSLNPLMTVGAQIVEAVRLHARIGMADARRRAADLLADVGVPDPGGRLSAYPHEFSGGMRQRAMIAMALAGEPDVLLCDEPTTALDVTTQARVLDLIDRICHERGLASVLITHDLGLAAGFCDEIAVMYAGQIVEHAPTDELYSNPRHPYTRALLASTVDLTTGLEAVIPAIAGNPPLPDQLDAGCAFRTRCPLAIDVCAEPVELSWAGGRQVRCVRADEPVADGLAQEVAGA
ncbi:ABC transporter ATP-binding protein [Actinoplanes sp. CA-030573]|uniref:ABC transporter ATP-binding protein n=1 Tax=Actinoplanes sp. CA-030573 TaxID=3239898 RepID=UPI003D94A502